MNLWSKLHFFNSKAVYFIRQGKEISLKTFKEDVKRIRQNFLPFYNKKVVIQLEDQYEFICTVTALDGLVSSMLLLPADLNHDFVEILSSSEKYDLIINDLNSALPCQQTVSPEEGDIPTDWAMATSGTTGIPKVIHHTFASLTQTVASIKNNNEKITWGLLYQPQRFAGLQVVLQSMLTSNTLVLGQNDFNSTVNALVTNSVNCVSATPSMWRKLLIDGRIKKLNFKQITLGGEISDSLVLNSLLKSFPAARIIHIYASTEAGVGFAVKDGKPGFPSSWLETGVKNVSLKISNKKTLLIKPKLLAEGHEISSRLDKFGYIDTEDLVDVDNDRVMFLGRESGAINVGGNKVSPEEVESIVRQFDKIIDVIVYSKSNPFMGQLVAADIVVDNAVLERKEYKKCLLSFCKNNLPLYKVPTFINFVDSISVNSNGKMERK
jgi:acyl-CoA synthetase (AMP-forming)/AMP-acid ligase II